MHSVSKKLCITFVLSWIDVACSHVALWQSFLTVVSDSWISSWPPLFQIHIFSYLCFSAQQSSRSEVYLLIQLGLFNEFVIALSPSAVFIACSSFPIEDTWTRTLLSMVWGIWLLFIMIGLILLRTTQIACVFWIIPVVTYYVRLEPRENAN